MAPVPILWPNLIFSASQGRDGIPIGVDVGIRANGGDTGEYPGLTSPALAVALAIIGLLSLTMFTIFGRRVMDAAYRRHRGQGMEHQTDSETREDHYLFLADMLGLDVPGHMTRGGTPQIPLLCDKPKLWNMHATPCGADSTRMGRPLCWGDITPIAAVVSQEEKSCVRDATPSPSPRYMTDRRMRCRHRQTSVRGAIRNERQGRGTEGSRAPLPHKSIQVVVAIAMPCRPGQVSRGSGDVAMDYSIGVHEIPWDYYA